MEALFLFIRYEFNDVTRIASDDVAESFQRAHRDVSVVSEIIKHFVVNSILKQIVLSEPSISWSTTPVSSSVFR